MGGSVDLGVKFFLIHPIRIVIHDMVGKCPVIDGVNFGQHRFILFNI